MEWTFEGKTRHPSPLKTAESSVSDVAASPTLTIPASPASSDGDRRFSFHSITSRARRSFSSRESVMSGTSPRSLSSHTRRLSKSRNQSTSSISIGGLPHRASGLSDDLGHLSVPDITSTKASPPSIDWASQKVESVVPLESDTQFLRTRTPYLVVTSDYLLKVKCRSDVSCLFPWLPDRPGPDSPAPYPDPVLLIPLGSVVSVLVAEGTRPSFGFEVWWKTPSGISFQQATFYFNLPGERDELMHHIARAMRASHYDDRDAVQLTSDVSRLISALNEAEEPMFKDRKPEIFPVVPRAQTRRDYIKKTEDSTKKPQEAPSFYLVIGTYLSHFVVVQRGKSGEAACQHRTFGLVTLEKLRGDWAVHEERFNISFRYPFAPRVVLELSSRFYRRIIRVLGVADRFLKPSWPQMWQTAEIFHVTGLKEPQYPVPREDFGSVKRTLDAYFAAYSCKPVEWEINWKTRYPPEFRLRPAKNGTRYSPLQLLAVLRALRYNDYFNSLSFRDVDLTVLQNTSDTHASSRGHVAYLSRTCFTLDANEVEILQQSSVLHQEFHALAFCSETIQQIDFTNCAAPLRYSQGENNDSSPNLQFLAPILSLLRSDITKCSSLVLTGNPINNHDLEDIVETLGVGRIYGLDVSSCGLCENQIRHLVSPFLDHYHPLQYLNISDNTGRLPASFLPEILYNLYQIKHLNLHGSLQADGDVSGTLVPFEILDRLINLEELDISGFLVNAATLEDLCAFLYQRAIDVGEGTAIGFRRLVLNHCGITGDQAARLCRAIGYNSSMHLSISGNPLEDGIDHLADAIRESTVPSGISMEVVEFKEESNYLYLIRALAETRAVSLLSLAGTAPTPSLDTIYQPCSCEAIKTLGEFFARNQSIRYLDMSGFSGKLEDGQLAKGFARSLAGLSKNNTMTHLRIRNQNLDDDVGTLGRALSENKTLRILDCQDNQLNLSSVKFLVSSVKSNHTVIDLPFSADERAAIWNNILQGLQKTSRANGHVAKGAAVARLQIMQESMLREVLDRELDELQTYLRRNRATFEESFGVLLDIDTPASTLEDMEATWRALTADRRLGEAGEHTYSGSDEITPTLVERPHRPTVRSSRIGFETSVLAPYHIRHGDDGADSPTDTLDPASEISTPPEMEAPAGPEELVFDKMVHELRAKGFDSPSLKGGRSMSA